MYIIIVWWLLLPCLRDGDVSKKEGGFSPTDIRQMIRSGIAFDSYVGGDVHPVGGGGGVETKLQNRQMQTRGNALHSNALVHLYSLCQTSRHTLCLKQKTVEGGEGVGGAQPMPGHFLPDTKCQLRWHL